MVETMEIQKGFKKTDVGIIPCDWDVKPISEITSLMTNGFVGTVKSHYTDYDNGILYIQGYNVEENSFNFNGIKRVTNEFHKQHLKSCLQEGDLLTIQTGDIGVTTIVSKELEGANCHALIITRFKKDTVAPRFYCYYFNYSGGRKRLKEIETGSTMKHINVGDMFQMLIPYPTKVEQTAIATALNDADALINQIEKLISKKRAIKQGAMQELLKPKEGWEVKLIPDIICKNEGIKIGPFGSSLKKEILVSKGFKVYGQENIFERDLSIGTRFIDKEHFAKLKACELISGDFIISMMGTIGKCMIVPEQFEQGIMDSHLIRLRLNRDVIEPKYLLHYFSSESLLSQVNKFSVGGIMDGLSSSIIKQISVPLPSKKEHQTAISQILSDMDAEIEELEKKLDKYKMIKQGMMQNLLTGKIRLI
jgi:type I restriction enzyme S subunit